MKSILLIDDNSELLDEFLEALTTKLSQDAVDIRKWLPSEADQKPREKFNLLVDEETILVVTDYDLTGHGNTGLFGSSIVEWCQVKAIPVGDYSRATASELPSEPSLFELRVPTEMDQAVDFIARVFWGFSSIYEAIASNEELLKLGSPAAVLAKILDVPTLESQIALYGLRMGSNNAALMHRIVKTAPRDVDPDDREKRMVLRYMVGHTLINSVLRFPGPILSRRALVAYIGCDISEVESIASEFSDAQYDGPFGDGGEFFWLFWVDDILTEMIEQLDDEIEYETHGELHRIALQTKIQRDLALHSCPRCDGRNGGFLCPFTNATVCERQDCSVASNSWIPAGATLCRIEKDFYDEWAPVLGI